MGFAFGAAGGEVAGEVVGEAEGDQEGEPEEAGGGEDPDSAGGGFDVHEEEENQDGLGDGDQEGNERGPDVGVAGEEAVEV